MSCSRPVYAPAIAVSPPANSPWFACMQTISSMAHSWHTRYATCNAVLPHRPDQCSCSSCLQLRLQRKPNPAMIGRSGQRSFVCATAWSIPQDR
jgi:hypothetical protein